ncbi:XRE family transcriptional regulator [Szabonella alba]|uniref:Helix-turn-helix domain-containing protein n=1 Tax=Szabonella alba TaxID=2804194 RepID=A0A8K0XZY1_9RHOB|nr:XRE family transcriptional regulator [Szabonella alba]MBL4917281.1 helix-turn-helix domain-containing protein [Szabonella alba]
MALSGLSGTRLRERRLALGLRQADLARAAGISPSFLNLIEHNRRRITPPVLERLAGALGVDLAELGDGTDRRRIEDLRAAAGMQDSPVEMDRIEDFLGRFPGWADLLRAQHRRLGQLERTVFLLNDRLGHDPHLSAALHEVLSALSSVRSTAAILAETEDIEAEWRARFHANLHADSERLASGAEVLVAYLDGSEERAQDALAAAPQDEVEGWLAARGWHLPELEPGAAGPAALHPAIAALASGAARSLAGDWLRVLEDDAARMPLAEFEPALAGEGGDPIRLARRFGVGVLAVFRRIAFRDGAVEGLVICDASGTPLIRKPLPEFALPRFGAACPLWPLFTALARPMEPVSALADLPGLVPQRFHLRAFCEPDAVAGFDGLVLRRAAMLIAPDPGAGGVGLPIGSSCRICPREACPARREPSILAGRG